MALNNENKSLVQFGYGYNDASSKVAGMLSFDTNTQAIYVGDGVKANLVSSSVKDAKFENSVLTISKISGEVYTLDFHDVASAEGVSLTFKALDERVKANASAISTETSERKAADASLSEKIGDLDASYKAADASLSDRIAKFESGDNSVAKQIENAVNALDSTAKTENDFFTLEVVEENGKVTGVNFENIDIASASDLNEVSTLLSTVKATAEAARTEEEVNTQITTKIETLGGSKTGTDASGFVTVKVDTTAGEVSSVTVTGSDIASASALAGVKATADAAAKQLDFNNHATNSNIHITDQERTDWNAAKSAIDAFLDENAVSDNVVNTLKEIQEYITKDGSAAADMLDAIDAAQTAADNAQDEVDTLEGVVSTLSGNFNTHNTNGDIHVTTTDKAKWNAAEQNAKDYADGLASNYDKAGDASKAETAAKLYSDGNLATAKTYAEGQASTAKSEAISAAATDATTKANTAENNAKGYADTQIDAITVNGVVIKDASLDGTHIKVGGTDTHSSTTVSIAIEDLYTQVQAASEAGVQEFAVNSDSSNYAQVDKSTGAVTLTIKKVALAEASETNTGVADAYDVKTSIDTAKSEAISTVKGTAADASNAETVAGAKTYAKEYADAQIDAAALRWTVLS